MDSRFLSIDELSQYLGIKKSTLYVWTCHKEIPYFKVGRLVKFDLPEIQGWLKKRKVKELP